MKFSQFKKYAEDQELWFSNKKTIPYWVDGYNTFNNVEEEDYEQFLSLFNETYPSFNSFDLNHKLESLREFILAQSKEDIYFRYCALAVAFMMIDPFISEFDFSENHSFAVVDNPLFLILSPTYRTAFFHSWNSGVYHHFDISDGEGRGRNYPFRPELGCFQITFFKIEPNLTYPHITYHDHLHILLFDDIYLHNSGTKREYTKKLLDIEASLVHIDTIVLNELGAANIELYCMDVLPQIMEAGVLFNKYEESRFLKPLSQSVDTIKKAKKIIFDLTKNIFEGAQANEQDAENWIDHNTIRSYIGWSGAAYDRNNKYSDELKQFFDRKEIVYTNYDRLGQVSCIVPFSDVNTENLVLDKDMRAKNMLVYKYKLLAMKVEEFRIESEEVNGIQSEEFSGFIKNCLNNLFEDKKLVKDISISSYLQTFYQEADTQFKINFSESQKSNFYNPYKFYGGPNFGEY